MEEFNKMDFDAIRDALGIPKAKETDKPNIPEPYGMEPYGRTAGERFRRRAMIRAVTVGGNGGNGGGTGPQSLMMGNRMRTRMPRRFSNEPLELAGSEPVEQESWQEDPRFTHGVLGFKRKSVQLGDRDWLNFEGLENREDDDPDVAEIVSAHGLSHPHEVLWSRGPEKGGEVAGGRFDVTGEGKAGQMVSHATHALRELVDRYKPVSIEFSGHEPSRQKVYHRMMRRMAEGNVGGGEYVFLHEPGRSFRARGGNIIHEPAYFHIVHQAAADLPRYRDMEEIGAREKVAMANELALDGEDAGQDTPKLSTDTPPVEYWKPTAPTPPDFGGDETHQKISNLYNNAIHNAPKELRERVKGTPPENFLINVPRHVMGAINSLGVGKGVFPNGRWIRRPERVELIQNAPSEMIRSEELPARRSIRRGISDLESYDPENPRMGRSRNTSRRCNPASSTAWYRRRSKRG